MYTLIALGNPGDNYISTRHNVGWIIMDHLIDGSWEMNKYMNAQTALYQEVLCIKPQTFMNRSGEVIPQLKKEYPELTADHIIVLYDDIDLPLGQIRISFDRGDGGHNGMKSIIEHLGSKKCIRIRIGVSERLEDGRLIKPNVLGRFSSEQHERVIKEITPDVQGILSTIVSRGYEDAMMKYNGK